MKKVLAFLSVFAFTLFALGLTMNSVQVSAASEPAEGKFFVNPTLEEGEIPMYIMNSIYTTFPNHYDYEGAQGTEYADAYYERGRLYPWNEFKLLIPQFDLTTGNPTGSTYAVYQNGANNPNGTAAGNYMYVYRIIDGVVTLGRYSRGVWTQGDAPADPSLDTIRHNIENVPVKASLQSIRDGGTPLNYVVFDGNGKMVRGLLKSTAFTVGGTDYQRPIFGFMGGELVLRDVVGDEALDRATELIDTDVPEIDDSTGQPKKDPEGNIIYVKQEVPTEEPKLAIGSEYRYIWQYYSEAEFASVKVNTVNYGQEGWLADRWDYAMADPNGGYVCLAIIGADSLYGKINATLSKVHNDSVRALIAAGAEDVPALIAETNNEGVISYAAYTRPAFNDITIPAGGWVYNFGYLSYTGDQRKPLVINFADIVVQGMYHGRDPQYNAENRAYNFSSAGLALQSVVQNNQSYIATGSLNRIEVLKGQVFKPSWVINHAGMLGGYTDLTDIFSYRALPFSDLKFEVYVDGVRTVYDLNEKYDPRFPSRQALQEGMLTDYFNWLTTHGKAKTAIGGNVELFMHSAAGVKDFGGTWIAECYAYTFWSNTGVEWGSVADPAAAGSFMDTALAYQTYKDFWTILEAALNAYNSTSYYVIGQWGQTRRFVDHIRDLPGAYCTATDTSIVPSWCGQWQPWAFTYETFGDMKIDFLTDFYNFLKDKTVEKELQVWPNGLCTLEEFIATEWVNHLGISQHAGYYPLWGHYEARPTASSPYFFGVYAEKWGFLLEHFEALYDAVLAADLPYGGSMWTPVVNFRDYLNNLNLFTAANIASKGVKLADGVNQLMASPKQVRDSGYVEVLPPTYSELAIDTSNDAINTSYEIVVNVVNTATGLSSQLTFQFVVVDQYTPIIKVDKSKLIFSGSTTKIDLGTVVQAYDHYYDAKHNQILGNRIDIDFTLPTNFDPENVKPGKYDIIARAHNGNKVVTTTFTITVNDNVAPILFLAEMAYVPYGGGFDAKAHIYTAYDEVDGNLLAGNIQHNWLSVDLRALDTSDPGSQGTVYITVGDSAGNKTTKSIIVFVGYAGDTSYVEDQLDQIIDALGTGNGGSGGESGGMDCSQLTGAYFFSFAAVAALAVLVLRKKH